MEAIFSSNSFCGGGGARDRAPGTFALAGEYGAKEGLTGAEGASAEARGNSVAKIFCLVGADGGVVEAPRCLVARSILKAAEPIEKKRKRPNSIVILKSIK